MFVRRLKADFTAVRQAGGRLVLVGDGSEGQTERERKLFANHRALAFGAWLAQQGLGNPSLLSQLLAANRGYEGLIGVPDGPYEGLLSLRVTR